MGIKRVPTYFNEFACIGGACEDNCCIGWEVDIDDESLEVYKSVGGEFGDRLRRYMNDENSFTLKNNRCPFLNDKKRQKILFLEFSVLNLSYFLPCRGGEGSFSLLTSYLLFFRKSGMLICVSRFRGRNVG